MPLPVRPLPVLQNWDCQGCSNCCRTYHVRVTPEERQKILDQNWTSEIGNVNPIVYDRRIGGDRLNHGNDGVCVFLGEDNRCKIHEKFGSAGKPFACRLFPFMLIPAGDHWRVGLRFACPTVIADSGKPIADHGKELKEYATIHEAEIKRDVSQEPAPALQTTQNVSWADLHRFIAAGSDLLKSKEPMERKLRVLLAYIEMMRKSKFESVTGHRLGEFLDLMSNVIQEEVPIDPNQIPKPGFVGRSLFRQIAAVYSRKDMGQDHGDLVDRGAFGRMAAAWRFAMGSGKIPKVHASIPTTATFELAEKPLGALPTKSEELLTRYFRTKIESIQFCGRANFQLSVWDGMEALVLTFPVMMWLTRVIHSSGMEKDNALETAVKIVDDNFGFNPLLGAFKQRVILNSIRTKNELFKLVAWYGK